MNDSLLISLLPVAARMAHLAQRQLGYDNFEYDDLYAQAQLVLVENLDSYDPSKNIPADRWAGNLLRYRLIDYAREHGHGYRSNRGKHSAYHLATQISFDAPMSTDSDNLSDVGHYLVGVDEEGYDRVTGHEVLVRMLPRLQSRERYVLIEYFLQEITLAEIGRSIGVTESRVSYIVIGALKKLRRVMKVAEPLPIIREFTPAELAIIERRRALGWDETRVAGSVGSTSITLWRSKQVPEKGRRVAITSEQMSKVQQLWLEGANLLAISQVTGVAPPEIHKLATDYRWTRPNQNARPQSVKVLHMDGQSLADVQRDLYFKEHPEELEASESLPKARAPSLAPSTPSAPPAGSGGPLGGAEEHASKSVPHRPGGRPPWTPERRAALADEYRCGATMIELGAKYGVSAGRIGQLLPKGLASKNMGRSGLSRVKHWDEADPPDDHPPDEDQDDSQHDVPVETSLDLEQPGVGVCIHVEPQDTPLKSALIASKARHPSVGIIQLQEIVVYLAEALRSDCEELPSLIQLVKDPIAYHEAISDLLVIRASMQEMTADLLRVALDNDLDKT